MASGVKAPDRLDMVLSRLKTQDLHGEMNPNLSLGTFVFQLPELASNIQTTLVILSLRLLSLITEVAQTKLYFFK